MLNRFFEPRVALAAPFILSFSVLFSNCSDKNSHVHEVFLGLQIGKSYRENQAIIDNLIASGQLRVANGVPYFTRTILNPIVGEGTYYTIPILEIQEGDRDSIVSGLRLIYFDEHPELANNFLNAYRRFQNTSPFYNLYSNIMKPTSVTHLAENVSQQLQKKYGDKKEQELPQEYFKFIKANWEKDGLQIELTQTVDRNSDYNGPNAAMEIHYTHTDEVKKHSPITSFY